MKLIVDIEAEYMGDCPTEEFTEEELENTDPHDLHAGIKQCAENNINLSFRLLDPETRKVVKRGQLRLGILL